MFLNQGSNFLILDRQLIIEFFLDISGFFPDSVDVYKKGLIVDLVLMGQLMDLPLQFLIVSDIDAEFNL